MRENTDQNNSEYGHFLRSDRENVIFLNAVFWKISSTESVSRLKKYFFFHNKKVIAPSPFSLKLPHIYKNRQIRQNRSKEINELGTQKNGLRLLSEIQI